MNKYHIFLYGPPGSGKTTLGAALAKVLNRPFIDIDELISFESGKPIPEIFSMEGEGGFRLREHSVIEKSIASRSSVIALGGGALINSRTRELVENNGKVLFLKSSRDTLLDRLSRGGPDRPLLYNPGQTLDTLLDKLLDQRKEHYESFDSQLDTSGDLNEEMVYLAQIKSGMFHIRGMGVGYDVLVRNGGLHILADLLLEMEVKGRIFIVSDENVASLYLSILMENLRTAGFDVHQIVIKPGESGKTINTVINLWESFTEGRLERKSMVVALGGGVVGDLAGFTAATYMRGISWVMVPTSLLSMVDASIGGKTGVDLPSGKNLVGAFHAPSLVLIDPQVLKTLPLEELQSGMAEVVKHGIIGDEILFRICQGGWEEINSKIEELICRAIGVKVRVIQDDPFEKSIRAVLNLGHTTGHALEVASDYTMRHGEAVSIGMTKAAEIAVELGVSESGLDVIIADCLLRLGLPVKIPERFDPEKIIQAIQFDKKKFAGNPRFVLPVSIGKVTWGVEIKSFERFFYDR